MKFTKKQEEVWLRTVWEPKRWNISVGAVRSGKTHLDYYRIPYRILHAGEGGIALIGNTTGTLERNILAPMRRIFGERRVGRIGGSGKVRLFGRTCLALGAYTANAADRLRGMSLVYCYGDEITTWNRAVFDMVKSRLDRRESVFDGSCNPDCPTHWFKTFLDNTDQADVAEFTIEDNTYLSRGFIDTLKAEYAGTVLYDRYILGQWKAAEGAVYPLLANAPHEFVTDDTEGIMCADVGVDFGGTGSATAFSLVGYTRGYKRIVTLDEYYTKAPITPAELERDLAEFIRRNERYGVHDVYCDSAEQLLIRGIRNALARERLAVEVHNARKLPISERIRFYTGMIGQRRFFIHRNCPHTLEAFASAVYDGECRLDDGTVNVDSLDAQEYATEARMREIIDRG